MTNTLAPEGLISEEAIKAALNASSANNLIDVVRNVLTAAAPHIIAAHEARKAKRRLRHKKRRTVYEIIGDARIQSDKPLKDYDVVTVYRCEQTGDLWAREVLEMSDGRFENFPPPPAEVQS